MSIKEFSDGISNTIALVECVNSGINWLEPRDLTFEQAAKGINQTGVVPGISSAHKGGANSLFFDGAVKFLPESIPHDMLRGLLTANGGEDVSSAFE
jgi:prepilin-type processing-associated H-X9-DG protein